MKRLLWTGLLAVCGAAWSPAQAQVFGDSNWQEGEAPSPPAFSMDRLIRFEVNPSSPLVFAVDPQTITISPADRVVRYVVVASSPTGSRNVFYEGIRCPAGEVKTYARHNGEKWVMAQDPQWLPMSALPSRHALQLARQGACENSGTPSRAEDVVRMLKLPAGTIVR